MAKQAAERKEKWVMGNYLFFRMHRITDIYFVGGFGTVQVCVGSCGRLGMLLWYAYIQAIKKERQRCGRKVLAAE